MNEKVKLKVEYVKLEELIPFGTRPSQARFTQNS